MSSQISAFLSKDITETAHYWRITLSTGLLWIIDLFSWRMSGGVFSLIILSVALGLAYTLIEPTEARELRLLAKDIIQEQAKLIIPVMIVGLVCFCIILYVIHLGIE